MALFKRSLLFALMMMFIIVSACAQTLGALEEVTPAENIETLQSIDQPSLENPLGMLEALEKAPELIHLLLIGTDGYADQINGRSDAMMLVRIDSRTHKIKIVSFMRDLFVKIPGKGRTRLNAAFVYGGAALLEETLFNNFGVTADIYIAVNFTIMKELVDTLGGVDLSITKAEMNQINKWMKNYYQKARLKATYTKLTDYGDVHLDGDQALAFSRIRNIDSDYERTRRQRDVISAIFKAVSKKNAMELLSLVTSNINKVETNIGLDDALKLAPVLLSGGDWTFETLRIPADKCYTSETISGMSVLVPKLEKNIAQIEAFWAQ